MTIRYPKSRLRQIIFIAAHVAAVTFILLWLWYMLGSHLVAHYFDLGRHETISTMAWEAIKTNIGANLWWMPTAVVIGVILWPPTRARIELWTDNKLHDHLTEHHNKLEEAIMARMDAKFEAVHDHIATGNDPRETK